MRRLLFAMSLMAAATSMSYAQVAKPADKAKLQWQDLWKM